MAGADVLDLSDVAFLSGAAFFTSMLTAVAGAGGGTLLIGLMLLVLPPAAAIPCHGLVQLFANGGRVWLFRRHLAWSYILRFGALMPFGVAIGIAIFQAMPAQAVAMLIGIFILTALFSNRISFFDFNRMPMRVFYPLGFVVGILNVLVGVVAPLLGVILIKRGLSKETIVGTLALFGVMGHMLKVGGFAAIGFDFVHFAWLIAAMVPSVLLGTLVGKQLLGRVSEALFRAIFQGVLVLIAAKLVLWDGLRALLGAG